MSIVRLRLAALMTGAVLPSFTGSVFAQEFRTALQIAPQGGGRCIEVPGGDIIRDKGLQMQTCNNSAAQTFTRDEANMRLIIGGLCIDANGGGPGDLVKLSPCGSGPGLVWRSESKGGFTKFVATSGLCLDIRYGSTENGALVQSWTCDDAAPNQLWSVQRK
jgi:Ricin-type beta-trefoil lectin domain